MSWNAVGHRLVETHYMWLFFVLFRAIDRFLKEVMGMGDLLMRLLFSRALCYLF